MLKRFLYLPIVVFSTICFFNYQVAAQRPPLQTIIIDPGHGGIDPGAVGAYSTEANCALAIGLKLRDMLKKEFPEIKVLMTRERDELAGGGRDRNASLKYRANFANQNHGDLFISIHLNATAVPKIRKIEGYRTENYTVFVGKGKKKKKVAKSREVPIYKWYKLPSLTNGTQTYIWAADKSNAKKNAVGNKEEILGENESVDSAFDAEVNSFEAKMKAAQYAKYYFQRSFNLADMVEDQFANNGRKSWGVMQRNELGIWVLQATGMPSILVETGFITNHEEEDYLNSEKGQLEVAGNVTAGVKQYKELLESSQQGPVIAVPVTKVIK